MPLNKHIFQSQQLQKLLTKMPTFFSEDLKLHIDIENAKKKKKMQQKVYDFLDNFIWITNGKFSLSLQEYS